MDGADFLPAGLKWCGAGFLQDKRYPTSFGSVPTAIGTITRLACTRLQEAGLSPKPLLAQAGLTVEQIKDRRARVSVERQIRLLNLAANAIGDELLGFHLAQACDLRELGLLYYVPASSQTAGEGLRRLARYVSLINESLSIEYREGKSIRLIFNHIGVRRHTDRHQIEFSLTILTRLCRHLTRRRQLAPTRVKLAHPRDRAISKIAGFLGTAVQFNARVDEVAFAANIRDIALLNADPYLNELLIAICEDAMPRSAMTRSTFAMQIEGAIAPLLPHGAPSVGDIASRLGTSGRTLSRRLAAEGLTFNAVLKNLRTQLAWKYLSDPALSISEIAWLLGYEESASFTHAFKRWTGKPPGQARSERRTFGTDVPPKLLPLAKEMIE
jgi:AraC-like DNA-binding protein